MTDRIGNSFFDELQAAGVVCVASWQNGSGTLTFVEGASEADKAGAQAILAAHDPMKPGPTASYGVLKTDVVSRMSDAELDRFDVALTSAATRARRMWTDCHEIRSDSSFFAGLQQQFTTAFGADRAKAILAASTT